MARALAFVLLLLCSLASSCVPPEDANLEVSLVMDQTVKALADKDASALADLLDDSYEDDAKRTKKDIEARAAKAFARGPVLLRMQDPELIIDSAETATIIVNLLAGNASDTIKSPADLKPANAIELRLFVRVRRDGNRVSRVFRKSHWKISAINGLPRD